MRNISLALALGIVINGCSSMAPPVPPADSNIPGQWGAGPTTQMPALRWNQIFTSPLIQRDIALAVESNKDLKKAALTALRAHQLINTVNGPLSVSAGVGGEYEWDVKSCCTTNEQTYGILGLSFDLDIWGRIKSATEAATLNAEAEDLTVKGVQDAIAADVIKAHLVIAYANQYHRVLDEMGRVLSSLEQKANARTQSGLPNSAELSRVLLKKANILAIRTQVEQQKSSAIEALRLLTSYHRQDNEYAKSLGELSPLFFTIPETTSAAVILNRPDIMSLDKKMRATNAEIGVAIANRLPQISIPVNLLALTTGPLFLISSPAITQSLYDGGRLKAIENAAVTSRDIALIEYERGIQSAFRDVANGISNANTMRSQVEIANQAQSLSQQAFNRTLARNDAGYDSLSDLIDRYEELLTANTQETKAVYDRATNAVALFAATGAGV
jgi:multidrug efflux system outer membrane protein